MGRRDTKPLEDTDLLNVLAFFNHIKSFRAKDFSLDSLQDLESSLDYILQEIGSLLLRLHNGNIKHDFKKALIAALFGDQENDYDIQRLRHAVAKLWSKASDYHRKVEWGYHKQSLRQHMREHLPEILYSRAVAPNACFSPFIQQA